MILCYRFLLSYIPPPVGPIILASLGLMQICSNLLESKDTNKGNTEKAEDPISKVDLMEARSAIINEIKTLDLHLLQESAKIIHELTMTIETTGFLEELRETLNSLQRTFVDMMTVVINPKATGMKKRRILDELLNYSSDYRYKLRSFITKFIKPNDNEVTLLKPVKLFFDFILEKENSLAANDNDCSSDSVHNKIFKSFIYILKILTEAYSMVVSAHFVAYQEELKNDTISDAAEYKENALSLINDYKNDAQTLIKTTKWALQNASQEIRNCGNFILEEGKTFARLSFIHMLPNILSLEYIEAFSYKCSKPADFSHIADYEIDECNAFTDDIPFGSKLEIAINLKKPNVENTPYSYMKIKKPDQSELVFGRNSTEFIILYQAIMNPECYTTFCTGYKNTLYAISTERVSAEPGNVITGLRFRIQDSVVYIDIQQGKFIDLLSVDPKTVYWTETPKSDQIAYLGSTLKKIELGDFVLKNNSILTSIQLKNTDGLIRVSIDGLTPPYMNNTESMSYENNDPEINEIKLVNADDPVWAGYNSKNLVSKPPVGDGKRYFVSFQKSDFKKDFGQSTLPLLDIREVISTPPAPLFGMGLYHEAVNGYGGLIALKLITPSLIDLVDSLRDI